MLQRAIGIIGSDYHADWFRRCTDAKPETCAESELFCAVGNPNSGTHALRADVDKPRNLLRPAQNDLVTT